MDHRKPITNRTMIHFDEIHLIRFRMRIHLISDCQVRLNSSCPFRSSHSPQFKFPKRGACHYAASLPSKWPASSIQLVAEDSDSSRRVEFNWTNIIHLSNNDIDIHCRLYNETVTKSYTPDHARRRHFESSESLHLDPFIIYLIHFDMTFWYTSTKWTLIKLLYSDYFRFGLVS